MTSNFACIGLRIDSEQDLVEVLERVGPLAEALGSGGGHDVFRWQDPSGARLVFSVRDGDLEDVLPSFAGEPGVRLRDVRVVSDDLVSADIVDEDGERTSMIAFELEQRRALRTTGPHDALAAVVALAPEAVFFDDEAAFAASRLSLLDPDADLDAEPPAEFVERGIPYPTRMASESFISYGVFGDPAEADAYARINGVVRSSDRRVNELTGTPFTVCRVASIGMELTVLTASTEKLPAPGSIVATQAFLAGSIDDISWTE